MKNGKSHKLPWVSIWMIGFSGMGLWMVVAWRADAWSVRHAAAILVLGVIFIVGFRRAPLSLAADPGEEIRPGMEGIGALYLKAWRRLWREKWLLRFFAIMLLMHVMGGVIEYGWAGYDPADQLAGHRDSLLVKASPLGNLISLLPSRLVSGIPEAATAFFPGAKLNLTLGAYVLAPIAFLVFILWSWARFGALASEQPPAQNARLVLGVMKAVIMLAIVTAISIAAFYVFGLHRTDRPASQPVPLVPESALLAASVTLISLWGIVYTIVTAPLLLGGLIGSLLRSSGNAEVSTDSFLRDTAKNFKPLAGLSIPLVGAAVLTILATGSPTSSAFTDWAMNAVGLLLMLVPFAIVALGLGTLEGIRVGCRVWLERKNDIIAFVALGITFVLMGETVADMLPLLFHPLSPLQLLIKTLVALIVVVTTAFMLVAVWEFYRRIANVRPEVKATEEGVGA